VKLFEGIGGQVLANACGPCIGQVCSIDLTIDALCSHAFHLSGIDMMLKKERKTLLSHRTIVISPAETMAILKR
jgi:hypothetical protein